MSMEETKYDLTTTGNSRKNLYVAVLVAYLSTVAAGFVVGWSSPFVLRLEAPGSEFPVTEWQGTWLASLVPLGTVFGPFFSNWLLDSVGRKRTILFCHLMILAGWGLMCVWSIWLMYCGRLLTGIGYGISLAVTNILIAEICEDSVRSILNSMFPLFNRGSLLLAFGLGPHISYHSYIFMSCIPIIVFLLMYSKLPESPHYLLAKDREEDAIKTLTWLRQLPDASVLKEIDTIKKSLSVKETRGWKDLFLSRGNLRALWILSGLHLFWQVSGGSVVLFYTQSIFQLSEITLRSDLCALLMAAMTAFGSVLSPTLVRFLGYKMTLYTSTLVSALSMGCFAYLIQQCELGNKVAFVQWSVVLSLAAFIITTYSGLCPISMSLMGEYFQPNMKAKGSTVITCVLCLEGFVSINLFPEIVASFGLSVVCWFSFVSLLLATLFVIVCVPETSGLSLTQIQDILNK